MPNPTINQCVVLVQRAPTVAIPCTVFEYEVAVLEEIHGEQDVTVSSTKAVPVPAGMNAATAYAQLKRKYNDDKGQEAIRFVYRNVQALSKASGLSYSPGDEDAIKFEESTIVVHDADPGAEVRADAAAKVAKAA